MTTQSRIMVRFFIIVMVSALIYQSLRRNDYQIVESFIAVKFSAHIYQSLHINEYPIKNYGENFYHSHGQCSYLPITS